MGISEIIQINLHLCGTFHINITKCAVTDTMILFFAVGDVRDGKVCLPNIQSHGQTQ